MVARENRLAATAQESFSVTLSRPLSAFTPFFAFAVLAAGCASDEALRLSEEPTYQAGYGDGCLTSTEEDKSFSTKRARDDYLFDNDRAYRAGWRQGYLQCGGRASDPDDGGRILGQQNEY
ncbi:MAG: hypothetical protein Kow00133_16190 [Amphiplicatus sp.]